MPFERDQRSERYYQRPDAKHIELDPTRTSLNGWGGRAMLSKTTGVWRPNIQIHAYSPGFETNDSGFMQRTDIISAHALMMYVDQNPTTRVRSRQGWFGVWQNRNFDGNTLEKGVFGDGAVTLLNYWNLHGALFLFPEAVSDRLTRGGPLVRTPAGWNSDLDFTSDDRKNFYFSAFTHLEGSRDDSYLRRAGMSFTARPASNLTMSLDPTFSRSHDHTQYVSKFADATATSTFGQRYVFADLEQRSFELGTRVDWTLSSRLSFQLYLQPFLASGDYHDYHTLDAANTRSFTPYARPGSDPHRCAREHRQHEGARDRLRRDGPLGRALIQLYALNTAKHGGAAYAVADTAPVGDFRFGRDLRAIPGEPSHDVFLIKLSYWLPM